MPLSGAQIDAFFVEPAAAIEAISRDEFAVFYEQTAPSLQRYLMRLTANSELADDLLQESFIRLIDAAPQEQSHRRAYLYRTATNLAMDHFRAVRRERAGLQFWKLWQPTVVETLTESSEVDGAF